MKRLMERAESPRVNGEMASGERLKIDHGRGEKKTVSINVLFAKYQTYKQFILIYMKQNSLKEVDVFQLY